MKNVIHSLFVACIVGFTIGCSGPDTTDSAENAGPSEEIAGLSESDGPTAPEADANNNRVTAGVVTNEGTLVELTAKKAIWFPQEEMAPSVDVYAFAEAANAPIIPGPFIRLRLGETLVLRITNTVPPGEGIGLPPPNRRFENIAIQTGDTLTIRGLETAFGADALDIPYGETRELRLVAKVPGEYFYWGSTTGRPLRSRTGPESQLTGLIVIDPGDGPTDAEERFFVITMIDAFPEKEKDAVFGDIFEPAINGRSWPKTEHLEYGMGKEVRWRWINGTGFEHPMHLHGFHFRVLEWSDGVNRITRNPEQEIVTELMQPGTTFSMVWTPTREGAWLMHCHIRNHVAGVAMAAGHDHSHSSVEEHAMRAMDGLVMGITVKEAEGDAEQDPPQIHRLRLVAMERDSEIEGVPLQGYALLNGENEVSAFSAPGPAIFLTRDVATRITIENQMTEPTAVHWHGLELQSMYDGIPGWSRTRKRVAPLLAPGDNFDVVLSPPKSGTFIYHTHMDATRQLLNGMYGPLIVLESGEQFNPDTDKIFLMGDSIDGSYAGVTINGRQQPAAVKLKAGVKYRFRFINISEGSMLDVSLEHEGKRLQWSPLAKDGADLPSQLRTTVDALFRYSAGETYDFAFTPTEPMELTLVIDWNYGTFVGGAVLRQPLTVE